MVSSQWTRYDFVDTIVLNEGEQCLVDIMRCMHQGRRPDLFYKLPRRESLDDFPSPYTLGLFDHMVQNNPDAVWAATIETNRGCPYACTFCDWGGLTQSKVKKFHFNRIEQELEWLSRNPIKSLYIADANFGIFYERDKEIARMVRQAADTSGIDYVVTNYTKHSNERVLEIARILGADKGITFSLQSLHPPTLAAIKRHNLPTSDAKRLLEIANQENINHYTDLILGLPLETAETWRQGLTDLLEMGQHNNIVVFPALVLENTELGDYQANQYNITTVDVVNGLISTDGIMTDQYTEVNRWSQSTSTMSLEEMVDSYMYAWVLINSHMNVMCSQLLAKYCRHVYGVPYRRFYDGMWARCTDQTTHVLGQQFRRVRSALHSIYTTGRSSDPDVQALTVIVAGSPELYADLDQVLDLCVTNAQQFGDMDPGIIDLQRRVLQNTFYQDKVEIHTQVDIHTWQPQRCVYTVEYPNVSSMQNVADFWRMQLKTKNLISTIRRISP